VRCAPEPPTATVDLVVLDRLQQDVKPRTGRLNGLVPDATPEPVHMRASHHRARARRSPTGTPDRLALLFAVYAARTNADDPLSGLEFGERPDPEVPDGWTTVTVKAAALNHHDLWSLRGVGLDEEKLPMILGCDAAGLDEEGNEVVVHSVIASPGWRGDETLDPKRSLLSERHPGTLAEKVAVPLGNLVPKPPELSFEEAACLPTAWLTAYRMLFTRANVAPGATVLVQGAGGGVATALIALGRAAGLRVWATSRSEDKRARAVDLGADEAFESGARLPERVDAVLETVGEATWGHSLRSLKPGGTLVVSGATSGQAPPAELNRVFFLQLSVVGSTMGTRDELVRLTRFCADTGARPEISSQLPLKEARRGFEEMLAGDLFGKVVFTP
jgi:NADPH:quinone reductase-like Zn-dependent oxidoreductase